MKFKFLLATLAFGGLLMTSCSNKYEKAIADYNQTIGDTKLDLGFKAIDVKEVKTITVADSLEIYKAKSDTLLSNVSRFLTQARQIHAEHKVLVEESIIKYPESKESGDLLLNSSLEKIKQAETDSAKYVDSFKKTSDRLQTLGTNEPLLVIVECKFSVETPIKMETAAKFKMSPDGKVCYGRYEEQ